MKTLQNFVNESLNPDSQNDQDFDLIFDEFVSTLESDDDKAKAESLKESWKKKFTHHVANAGHSAKGFLKSLWHDNHV